MDFIERLFGVSPDGGHGGLELLLLIGPILAIAAFYWRRKRARNPQAPGPPAAQ